jgi:hypothetical protein
MYITWKCHTILIANQKSKFLKITERYESGGGGGLPESEIKGGAKFGGESTVLEKKEE